MLPPSVCRQWRPDQAANAAQDSRSYTTPWDTITEVGDDRFRRKCATAFRERMARADIILVTHNSRTMRQYCDRGAILAGGELRLFEDIASALDAYHRMFAELH
jgi:ABC-type polysaccharide/polyol phosphate transport system ATPase subunit